MTLATHDSVAARIRRARALAGDPAASKISKAAGLAQGHVAFIDAGDIKTPDLKTIQKLAAVFGVTVEWLLLGTGPEPKARAVRRATETALRVYRDSMKRGTDRVTSGRAA